MTADIVYSILIRCSWFFLSGGLLCCSWRRLPHFAKSYPRRGRLTMISGHGDARFRAIVLPVEMLSIPDMADPFLSRSACRIEAIKRISQSKLPCFFARNRLDRETFWRRSLLIISQQN